MFELKAPNLNQYLLKKNISLKLVISKILSITFIIATLLSSHIKVAFQFNSIWLNLSENISKYKGYKYTNIIFRVVINLF